jgi:hypothetical protein
MDRKLKNELRNEVKSTCDKVRTILSKPEIDNIELRVLARCAMALENWLEKLNSG